MVTVPAMPTGPATKLQIGPGGAQPRKVCPAASASVAVISAMDPVLVLDRVTI